MDNKRMLRTRTTGSAGLKRLLSGRGAHARRKSASRSTAFVKMRLLLATLIILCFSGCDSAGTSGTPSIHMPPADDMPADNSLSPAYHSLVDSILYTERDLDRNWHQMSMDSVGHLKTSILNWTVIDSISHVVRDSIVAHFEPRYLLWLPSDITTDGCSVEVFGIEIYQDGLKVQDRSVRYCQGANVSNAQIERVLVGFDSLRTVRERAVASFINRGCHLFNGANC